MMMVLEECTLYPCSYNYGKASLERTHRRLKKGIDYFDAALTVQYSMPKYVNTYFDVEEKRW